MFNYLYPIIFQTETETEKCTRVANLKDISYKGVLCSVNDDHMNNINTLTVTDSEVAPRNINPHLPRVAYPGFPRRGANPRRVANILYCIIVPKTYIKMKIIGLERHIPHAP